MRYAKKVDIKLNDIIEDDNKIFLLRKISLRTNKNRINCIAKISKFSDINRRLNLNEIYKNIRIDDIYKINNDKDIQFKFINSLKLRDSTLNFPILNIYIPNKSINIDNYKIVMDFVIDTIINNPRVEIIVPPIINYDDDIDSNKKSDMYIEFIEQFIQQIKSLYSNSTIAFMIPNYITRNKLTTLLSNYIKEFGSSSIVLLDNNGMTFSSIGYSVVSQILRVMHNTYNEENYAIYIFNHKSKKKSGKEVPSEDILAFLNGVNLTGPLHKQIKIPAEVMANNIRLKIFNKNDFLYHPYNESINRRELDKLNDKNILEAIDSILYEPTVINNIKDNVFYKSLKEVSRKRNNIISEKPLDNFFNL